MMGVITSQEGKVLSEISRRIITDDRGVKYHQYIDSKGNLLLTKLWEESEDGIRLIDSLRIGIEKHYPGSNFKFS